MNHAELSKELAIALGYYPESVRIVNGMTPFVYTQVFRYQKGKITEWSHPAWVEFDYRAPDVALAMVELLGESRCYLRKGNFGWWCDGQYVSRKVCNSIHEAAARAVIALKAAK